MSLRIAILAEGARETGFAARPAPGSDLADERHGPAHVLVRRLVAADSKLPPEAVRFVEPLRTSTGLVARGSHLGHKQIVRQLLVGWAPGQKRPDLFVVLRDADGQTGRDRELEEWTSNLGVRRAIGVPIQEFEAWLVSESPAVQKALGCEFARTPDPEVMRPREAKELLDRAIALAGHLPSRVRTTIAELVDLDALTGRCRAFSEFRTRLRAAVQP